MTQNNTSSNSLNTTCILVANGSEAKLYLASDKDLFPTNLNHVSLQLIDTFEHPSSREKSSELMSEGLGNYASMGLPGSNFEQLTDPHTLEIDKFSKQLADMLDKKRNSDNLHALILICPARFYGALNKHLSKHVSKLIKQVIEKDYTKESTKKLVEHLQQALTLK